MARYKYYSYEQGQFISVQFEQQILPDTFEYALNYIVDNVMDMSIFAGRIKNDETGAPAYDPKIMLKIVFYAYARGIISSREIEKSCEQNVVFMALAANTRPHFTTIAEFISTMKDGIEPLFLDVLMYCDRLGLIGKEMFAIDGCKISSNASKEWSGTREDFEKKKQKYESAISYLVKKHREEDEKKETPTEREKETKAKEGLEAKVKKIQQWLEENDDKKGVSGKATKSPMVDNESAKMVSSHGVVQGYNGVAAVDAKHQVIVEAKAFGSGSEQELLKPMLEGIDKNFKGEDIYKEAKVAADSGFHNGDNMEMLKERNIDAYVADNQYRKRDPRFLGVERHRKPIDGSKWNESRRKYFGPDDFKKDEATGKLECPAGKLLYVKNRNFKTTKGHYGTSYMARVTDCRACPLRLKCLQNPNVVARQVTKFEGRDLTKRPESKSQWMRDKIDSVKGRFLYSLRMGIVEPVFGNIRSNLGLDRFTLRGQAKVDSQWKMYAIVHNMLKVYRYGWVASG